MNKMEIQILKGLNVSSKIILILIGIVFNNVYSQTTLKGSFCIDYDLMDFSNCITFESDNKFTYKFSGHLGTKEYGEGIFKLMDNFLIVDYNRTLPKSLGYYNLSIWENNSDSIDLAVSVYDKRKSEPIEYANVFFKDSTNKLGYTGSSANEDGYVEIKTIKDGSQIELNVIYLGFVEQKINLIRNKNYNIEVYLKEQADETGAPILHQLDTMEIVTMKSKYFTVKNNNGIITTWRKIEN